jgi:hypothetical protein
MSIKSKKIVKSEIFKKPKTKNSIFDLKNVSIQNNMKIIL